MNENYFTLFRMNLKKKFQPILKDVTDIIYYFKTRICTMLR